MTDNLGVDVLGSERLARPRGVNLFSVTAGPELWLDYAAGSPSCWFTQLVFHPPGSPASVTEPQTHENAR